MSNNRLSRTLSVYFAGALLLFALIISGVFVALFKNQRLETNKIELEKQATNIAENVSAYMESQSGGMGGFSMYLRLIDDVVDKDVWIVDADLNLITSSRGNHMHSDVQYADLPKSAEQLVMQTFKGSSSFSEEFSVLLSEATLSVGVPIFNQQQEVVGVVLLHSAISGLNQAMNQAMIILAISVLLALVASFLLSVVLSISFTKPLIKMKKTALLLVEGKYNATTGITQHDEIGELAQTLDVLAKRLDEASKQSEQLENMRREFVANISHELKTPVTVIRGSLEALVDKVVTSPQKMEAYHVQMLHESMYLERLVKDLLELSKLQSVDFTIEKQELSLCDVLDDVVRSVDTLAKKANVKLKVEKDTEHCGFVGDYGRLRQMIMIILDNAIKFSTSNDVVKVRLTNHSLSIQDFGIGISDADLPHIFDRFYKSRSEQNKLGTGLGLAIAKKIADRHNMTLDVQSKVQQGSTFTLTWE